MSFARKFCGRSPFKHGDGSGISPADQARADLRREYGEKHGSASGGSDEEWAEHQAQLKSIQD
tara:strand:+ start:216 stop:404 length:189 start_codon:yes stop_codon:yes gene_type:complete